MHKMRLYRYRLDTNTEFTVKWEYPTKKERRYTMKGSSKHVLIGMLATLVSMITVAVMLLMRFWG